MKVVSSIDALAKLNLQRPYVTWGIFDGVHRGHQAILNKLTAAARKAGSPAAVITFDPHPEEVLYGRAVRWLAPLDLRLRLIGELGVEACAVQKFSREFSEQGPEEFFRHHIAGALKAGGVVLGYDSSFGRDRAGNLALTQAWGTELGIKVSSCESVDADGGVISSTRIREALGRGDVPEVTALLGRPYRLVGHVISGRRRGREVGFPTCNLEVHDQTIPALGVYGGRARVSEATYVSVINVGVRPTFETDPGEPVVEAHLLDCAQIDAYGERLELDFEIRIRDEMKFSGPEALHEQIRKDIQTTRKNVRS